MPLARIDISKSASGELIRIVSEAVYRAMVEVANVPAHDKFQVINRHAADEMIYPQEGYLGLNYTPGLIIIQVTWVGSTQHSRGRALANTAPEIRRKSAGRLTERLYFAMPRSASFLIAA